MNSLACRLSASRRVGLMACLLLTTSFAAPVLAGDPAAGEQKSQPCAACHGARGLSEMAPVNPILAGQYESYLVAALQAYRSGSRQNAIMQGFATQLSDEDIDDLAAWFSSQEGPLVTAPIN